VYCKQSTKGVFQPCLKSTNSLAAAILERKSHWHVILKKVGFIEYGFHYDSMHGFYFQHFLK